jgi:Fic family protein
MAKDISQQIIEFLSQYPGNSSSQVHIALGNAISYATVKRTLTKLLHEGYIISSGRMKSTTYSISPGYALLHRINIEEYFQKEIDERHIHSQFNFSLIRELLPSVPLFTESENEKLNALHQEFLKNVQRTNAETYNKEMERLAIDLSWKSSQIEGNTYSLLETERLLMEKVTAAGKPKDDATMLLNHKEAINFITAHKDYTSPLTLRSIEDIHSILMKDLNVDRNIRTGRVGITGTNYSPLDNEHQVREAMQDMCTLINKKGNVFEKALLTLLLISYIQPFNDGNKRTSRIISNAQLMAKGYCPLSFRTVDAIDYKKAMLIFYEQNNVSAFKKIFMEQYEFAVTTYF